jgi:hypothetical protein
LPGLIAVDPANDLSTLGQVVVLLLIQASGPARTSIRANSSVVDIRRPKPLSGGLSNSLNSGLAWPDTHSDQAPRKRCARRHHEYWPAADEVIFAGDVLALLGSNERLNQLDQADAV